MTQLLRRKMQTPPFNVSIPADPVLEALTEQVYGFWSWVQERVVLPQLFGAMEVARGRATGAARASAVLWNKSNQDRRFGTVGAGAVDEEGVDSSDKPPLRRATRLALLAGTVPEAVRERIVEGEATFNEDRVRRTRFWTKADRERNRELFFDELVKLDLPTMRAVHREMFRIGQLLNDEFETFCLEEGMLKKVDHVEGVAEFDGDAFERRIFGTGLFGGGGNPAVCRTGDFGGDQIHDSRMLHNGVGPRGVNMLPPVEVAPPPLLLAPARGHNNNSSRVPNPTISSGSIVSASGVSISSASGPAPLGTGTCDLAGSYVLPTGGRGYHAYPGGGYVEPGACGLQRPHIMLSATSPGTDVGPCLAPANHQSHFQRDNIMALRSPEPLQRFAAPAASGGNSRSSSKVAPAAEPPPPHAYNREGRRGEGGSESSRASSKPIPSKRRNSIASASLCL